MPNLELPAMTHEELLDRFQQTLTRVTTFTQTRRKDDPQLKEQLEVFSDLRAEILRRMSAGGGRG